MSSSEDDDSNERNSEDDKPKPIAFGDPDLSDVTLVVEKQEFRVHKLILANHSDVFKAMFFGQFKELKAVRSLLDKITPTNKHSVFRKFLKLRVFGPDPIIQLDQVVEILFDQIMQKPLLCPLYAELCRRQVDYETKRWSPFRNAILNKAQRIFVEAFEGRTVTYGQEMEEDYADYCNRKLVNVYFIGHLYKQSLLSIKMVQGCLHYLLRHTHPVDGVFPLPPYNEESIHCAIQLIEVVRKDFMSRGDWPESRQYLKQLLAHLMKIAPSCSEDLRLRIFDVNELRKNDWVPVDVGQALKKMTEIHKKMGQGGRVARQERVVAQSDRVELKGVPVDAFRRLLEVVYNGSISDKDKFLALERLMDEKVYVTEAERNYCGVIVHQWNREDFTKQQQLIVSFWTCVGELLATADRYNMEQVVLDYLQHAFSEDICCRQKCIVCLNYWVFAEEHGLDVPQKHRTYFEDAVDKWFAAFDTAPSCKEQISMAVMKKILEKAGKIK